MRASIPLAQRIVVKVGTSTLTHDNGTINLVRMDKLARILSDLVNQGKQIILVSSGAIAVGVNKLKMTKRPTTTPAKQAAAAVGQSELMHLYAKFFSEYGHIVAQVLLTKDVVETQPQRTNVINTFDNLLAKAIIPIVNENDTVATDEIEFGDNDTLSALVATLIEADLLILLSDIEGLYDADPRQFPTAHLIPTVNAITPEIVALAGGAGTQRGTGGMATKIKAATIATTAHIAMIITDGAHPENLIPILEGQPIGTFFQPL
jgi:glutamate 5-kinase